LGKKLERSSSKRGVKHTDTLTTLVIREKERKMRFKKFFTRVLVPGRLVWRMLVSGVVCGGGRPKLGAEELVGCVDGR